MINNRRDFLKKLGYTTLPFVVPTTLAAQPKLGATNMMAHPAQNGTPINFITDGLEFSPQQYLAKLDEINSASPIETDFYGYGGAVQQLEETFAKATGKEKAIYLPSGTMANQIALKLLSSNNTKVLVPENSHIFRDEADAAQSVHAKRLVPVGKGKAFFNLNDLEACLKYIDESEVFKNGLGAIAIESPVRRADGAAVPLETLKAITDYCKNKGLKLHLDGARLHIAAAFTNVSVADYSACFDTVYVSLYKYLNAAGGGILCGDAEIIEQVAHQIKIYGGTVYQNWATAAMALHYLNGIDERWKKVVENANVLIAALNKIDGVSISTIENGTNIFNLKLGDNISSKKLGSYLYKNHNMWVGRPNEKGVIKLAVNETLLTTTTDKIVTAWREGIKSAVE